MAERFPPRVLIVDDQPAMARTMARLLRDTAEVTTATSGAEALARITSGERFELVLSDIMMPEMTGLELFERVRAIDAQAAATFVFTTGGISPEHRAQLASTGARCIMKPCDVSELRKLLEQKAE
ncbi:MAG: response regulator [Polyangiaceae bacterium]|jgi:CheY-like chemotaxis protein